MKYLPELSTEVLIELWETLPSKALLPFLDTAPAKRRCFKGFQKKASTLKNSTFRQRCLALMEHDEDFYKRFVELWLYVYQAHVKAVMEAPPESVLQAAVNAVNHIPQVRHVVSLALLVRGDEAGKAAHSALDSALSQLESLEPRPLVPSDPQPEQPEDSASTPSPPADCSDWKAKCKELQTELESKSATLASLQSRLERLEAEVADLRESNKQLESKLHKVRGELADAKRAVREAEQRKQKLEHFFEQVKSGVSKAFKPFNLDLASSEKEAPPAPPKAPRPAPEGPKEPPPEQHDLSKLPPEALDVVFQEARSLLDRAVSAVESNSERALAFIRQQLHTPEGQVALELAQQDLPWLVPLLEGQAEGLLIDASNVAMSAHQAKGKLSLLESAREAAWERGFFPLIIIADASLKYNIDDPEGFKHLVKKGLVEEVPAGTEADFRLAELARERGFAILTNDKRLPAEQHLPATIERVGFGLRGDKVYLKRPGRRKHK